ncbi:MAG: hypothetical protein QXF52_06915 [Thermoproteota archaeon]
MSIPLYKPFRTSYFKLDQYCSQSSLSPIVPITFSHGFGLMKVI